jgi:hypothetical protein|tara:strand:+ start:430 stop:651 length:222 start_codon:yes stop_codon:yes gene_type:complete
LIAIACFKLFDSPKSTKWTSVFVLTGAVSIYSIPTNVYFIFGLAAWVALIFVSKINREEFKIPDKEKQKELSH